MHITWRDSDRQLLFQNMGKENSQHMEQNYLPLG